MNESFYAKLRKARPDSRVASEYLDRRVAEVSGSMGDVDWREMEEDNRWAGFSDEDLELVSQYLPGGGLVEGAREQQRRRRAERTSYRGPGVYRRSGAAEWEVLGTTRETDGPQMVVMRDPLDPPGVFQVAERSYFDGVVFGGRRRYEYVRPLATAERNTAPVSVKVISAEQGWCRLQCGEQFYSLHVGDTFEVPTQVAS